MCILALSFSLRCPGVIDREQPGLPPEVSRLLDARTPSGVDAAWGDFVAVYSRLLVHVARALTSDRDAAMDAYTHVLERLREDDLRRLRTYEAHRRIKFTTWLVAVVRRLCHDWHRQRFGRARAESSDSAKVALERRRRLATLMSEAGLDAGAWALVAALFPTVRCITLLRQIGAERARRRIARGKTGQHEDWMTITARRQSQQWVGREERLQLPDSTQLEPQ